MPRARALIVVVLLFSYGALGARQPAVRASVPLPAPAATLAEALGLPVADRSRIILDIVRLAFGTPDHQDRHNARLRAQLDATIRSSAPGETAPLPLDPSIWRDTILAQPVPDERILAAILSDRRTALLYHGLAALDDETLGWLGPERDLLVDLLANAGAFAAFAPSLQIRAGRVVVPGGPAAEPLWESVVGASPARPVAFVRRLFSASQGRLAFFYDTVAQLDEPRQRFALAADRAGSTRADHVRALARVFERAFGELRPADRPYSRNPVDPAITLATLAVSEAGIPAGPADRRFWDVVFRHDEPLEPRFEEVAPGELPRRTAAAPLDAAWLSSRIHGAGLAAARRRLDAFLFSQRVFEDARDTADSAVATALRGVLAFPTLMLTLERVGVTSRQTLAAAATRAHAINTIGDDRRRAEATRLFQTPIGIIDRAVVMGGLKPSSAAASIASLLAVDLARRDAAAGLAVWIENDLLPALAAGPYAGSPESVVLAALAGANAPAVEAQIVEWEGRRYRVSPQQAELTRLRRVRARQRGMSLDEALAAVHTAAGRGEGDASAAAALGNVLASILYAAHLGDPESRLFAADNVALRHDLGTHASGRLRPLAAWRFAVEVHGQPGGWRLFGSLLGLDVPLARFTLRRFDLTTMPPAPRLTANESQSAAVTVALMRPHALTDATRDEIAAAMKRGRARLAGLSADPEELTRLAREAGLSAWRRESLAWVLQHDRAEIASHLSPLELLWLGAPRPGASRNLEAWGAASVVLSGCLCLQMPRPGPWEFLAGRPSVGVLATRGADVALVIAQEFAALRLPAALVPAVMAFAMQDVLDRTQPAYFDDWTEFGRAARSISREQVIDHVAALASGGPLLPIETDDRN